jgi:hypothetical protein
MAPDPETLGELRFDGKLGARRQTAVSDFLLQRESNAHPALARDTRLIRHIK